MATTQSAKKAVAKKASQPAAAGNAGNGEKPTMYRLLEDAKPQIERALPQSMTAERFTRIALTTIRQNPSLMKSTPASLMGALMTAAQLGLEPGPLGHAYIIPYWNGELETYEAQFQLGYTGIIDLARRSEHIETITARAVYEADHFHVEYGLDERLEHTPQLDGDRGELRFVYAYAKYVGGGHNFVVLSREDIEKARQTSQTGRKNKGPWFDWYEQMALKTAIKRLRAYLPLSVEMADAFAADERKLEWSPESGDVVDIPAAAYSDANEGELGAGDPDDDGPPDDTDPETGETTPPPDDGAAEPGVPGGDLPDDGGDAAADDEAAQQELGAS